MHAAVVDIGNDCEFQHNDIVQAHAVVFDFFIDPWGLKVHCWRMSSLGSPPATVQASVNSCVLAICDSLKTS